MMTNRSVIKVLCCCILMIFCKITGVQCAVLQSISVKGLSRMEYITVVSKLPFSIGDDIVDGDINRALKLLYQTQYFSNITMHMDKSGVLHIMVVENPTINEVLFGGISNKLSEALKQEVQLKARGVYTKDKIKSDAERIRISFQKSGKLNVAVTPKIEILERNRVNVLFDINEGKVSRVDSIFFLGNQEMPQRKLFSAITNRGTSNLFFRGKVFEEDSLDVDQSGILQLYMSRGFADAAVNYIIAEYEKATRNFAITYDVTEGQTYFFGDLSVDTEIQDIDLSDLQKTAFKANTGDIYAQEVINKTILEITEYLTSRGHAFIKIEPIINKDPETRTIDVRFSIKESFIVYIGKINILGTTRTIDSIVRRELLIKEGDLYNKALIKRSKIKLQVLHYFEGIEFKERKTDKEGIIDLDVIVQDLKQTGSVSFSIGYSTLESFILNLGISKNNIGGHGYSGSIQGMFSLWRRTVSIGFSDPHFLGSNVNLGFDVSYTNIDPIGASSGLLPLLQSFFFRQNSIMAAMRLGYPITDRIFHSWSLFYRFDDMSFTNPQGNAQSSLFKDEVTGRFMSTAASHTLSYDHRDNSLLPTRGVFASITQTASLPLPYQLHYISHDFFGGIYIPITKNGAWVFSTLVRGGAIMGYDGTDIPFQYRYSLGYYNMRGFYFGGVGPHVAMDTFDPETGDTTTTFVGGIGLRGNYYYVASFELRIPTPLPREYGLNIVAFMDVGSSFGISGVPLSPSQSAEFGYQYERDGKTIDEYVVDSPLPRVAIGAGILYMSPMGPIRLEFAFPVYKQVYDTPLVVRLHFSGTPI